MKKHIMFIILGVIIVGVLFGIYYYNYGNWVLMNDGGGVSHNYDDGGVPYIIDNEETAIAIGSAILKDFEPEAYDSIENDIAAAWENGVWTVYNEVRTNKNRLRKFSVKGVGSLYVQFKENGEILRAGVVD